MIAASRPMQRPRDARLLVVDSRGAIVQTARAALVDHLRAGDLVVANDAATLPASLSGTHMPTGAPVEVRLAGRASLAREDLRFSAVVFGVGDWRTRRKVDFSKARSRPRLRVTESSTITMTACGRTRRSKNWPA